MGVLRERLVQMGLGTHEEMKAWEGPEHTAALQAWWEERNFGLDEDPPGGGGAAGAAAGAAGHRAEGGGDRAQHQGSSRARRGHEP